MTRVRVPTAFAKSLGKRRNETFVRWWLHFLFHRLDLVTRVNGVQLAL